MPGAECGMSSSSDDEWSNAGTDAREERLLLVRFHAMSNYHDIPISIDHPAMLLSVIIVPSSTAPVSFSVSFFDLLPVEKTPVATARSTINGPRRFAPLGVHLAALHRDKFLDTFSL